MDVSEGIEYLPVIVSVRSNEVIQVCISVFLTSELQSIKRIIWPPSSFHLEILFPRLSSRSYLGSLVLPWESKKSLMLSINCLNSGR